MRTARQRLPAHRHGLGRVGHALCLLAALALLAACGSSKSSPDDRIFANNATRQSMQSATSGPPTQPPAPTPTPTPPASPAALLTARGASSRFYVAIGGQLVQISADGTARQLPLPARAELLALDWSPNGDQIAVAVGQRDKKTGVTAVSILVLDKDGKTTRTVASLLTLPAVRSTPAGPNGPARVMVDWGLVDNQIAVVSDSGTLVLIPAKGDPRTSAIDLKGQTVRAMRIAPRGDSVALLTADASGRGTISTVRLAGGAAQAPKALVGFGADGQHSITAFGWLSDGQHLLFTQADPTGDPLTGGELYIMNTRTRDERLVDTGGRAGPSAGIVVFTPSPDGKTIAYVIGVKEGTTWVANSLWVRSLRGAGLLPVSIGNAAEIDGLWWTPGGLVWATRVASDGASGSYEMIYFLQPPNGPPHELVRVAVKHGAPATPNATPLASPVASPGASPVASPAATPGG